MVAIRSENNSPELPDVMGQGRRTFAGQKLASPGIWGYCITFGIVQGLEGPYPLDPRTLDSGLLGLHVAYVRVGYLVDGRLQHPVLPGCPEALLYINM